MSNSYIISYLFSPEIQETNQAARCPQKLENAPGFQILFRKTILHDRKIITTKSCLALLISKTFKACTQNVRYYWFKFQYSIFFFPGNSCQKFWLNLKVQFLEHLCTDVFHTTLPQEKKPKTLSHTYFVMLQESQ